MWMEEQTNGAMTMTSKLTLTLVTIFLMISTGCEYQITKVPPVESLFSQEEQLDIDLSILDGKPAKTDLCGTRCRQELYHM